MDPEICRQLAPSGVLRAGINLSNFLLVSSRTSAGEPAGVSPDMARAIADHLGLELEYVTYPSPGKLADAARHDEWDIALIGAEPQRAEVISFTPAYAEIEATYLAPAGSRLHTVAAVEAPGVRIAVTDRTAYGLWLDRNIHQPVTRARLPLSLRAGMNARSLLSSLSIRDVAVTVAPHPYIGLLRMADEAFGHA